MSVIIKYIGLFFLVIIIVVLVAVNVGSGNKDIKDEKEAQIQNLTHGSSELYQMYLNLDGDQSQIIDLIRGKAELNMVYSGKSKFTAKLFDSNGDLLTVLADVNGPYNGKQLIIVQETGAYLLNVKTSGERSASKE